MSLANCKKEQFFIASYLAAATYDEYWVRFAILTFFADVRPRRAGGGPK
jgi:hypothetical protein